MESKEVQVIKGKKKFLKKYRVNQSCIRRLEDKVSRLDDRITAVKSPNYTGMPRGGTPVTVADLISDKLELEERIARLKNTGKHFRGKILDDIDSLEDPRYCEVLEEYCIGCKSIKDIAEDMGYTERHVYELYKEAVEELAFKDVSVSQ